MEYKFSVVMPVYNRSPYLREALDSILTQTYKASEIIVVDDGSTDDSWNIIESYGSLLRTCQIENSGAGNARKVGASLTRNNWIAFCDSDDIWLPTHLERRVRLLEKYPETNFSFSDMEPFGAGAISDRTYFSDGGDEWWKDLGVPDEQGFIPKIGDSYRKFLTFNPVATPTIVISQQLYKEIGGINSKYSKMPAEDADLTRRAVAIGTVACDLTITAMQRRHDHNMSRVEVENLLGKIQILEDHLDRRLVPHKDIVHVKEEISKTTNSAILASFYKRDYSFIEPIKKNISYSKLPIGILARLWYLQLFSK
jgi:glycosyltransferase involved in cell wall biosynthesis